MTGFPCIEVQITIRCGRETRPPIDGIATRCGEERVFTSGTVDQALFTLRQVGWVHTSGSVYCPTHRARREDAA